MHDRDRLAEDAALIEPVCASPVDQATK